MLNFETKMLAGLALAGGALGAPVADGAADGAARSAPVAGAFDQVPSYAGDLPSAEARGQAALASSDKGTTLRVGVVGASREAKGLFAGEALVARIHDTPCRRPTRGAIADAPVVEMVCNKNGWCAGASTGEWTPAEGTLAGGLSVVVYDLGSDAPGADGDAMLCADLEARVPKLCPKGSRPHCAGDGAELGIGEEGGLECSDGGEVECRRRTRPDKPDSGGGGGGKRGGARPTRPGKPDSGSGDGGGGRSGGGERPRPTRRPAGGDGDGDGGERTRPTRRPAGGEGDGGERTRPTRRPAGGRGRGGN